MKKNLLLIVLFFTFLNSHYIYAQLVKTLNGHDGDVLCLKLFPKSNLFATGGSDNSIIIWDFVSLIKKDKLESKLSNVLSIAISEDESKLYTTHDAAFGHLGINMYTSVWDLNNSQEVFLFPTKDKVNGICTSTDGAIVAWHNYDEANYTNELLYTEYNVKSGTFENNTVDTYEVKKSGIGHWLASLKLINVAENTIASCFDGIFEVNGYIAIINTKNKKVEKYLFTDKNKFSGDCFDASPDGKLIAAANYGGENWIYLWNVQSGTSAKTFKGHENDVMCVAFSPDNNYLASGDQDGKIVLWEVKSGKKIKSLTGHSGDVNCITFSPDGKYIISGGNDKLVKVWDAIAMIPDLKIYATEYELKYGILKKLQDELKEQTNLLESNFTPKGEFETTEAFELRLKEKNDKINGINKFYQAKFEELKDRKKQELDVLEDRKQSENEMAIQNSRRDTTVNISNVSTYNADKQTYAITINGITKNVLIPIDKAPKFKENLKKAKSKM
ncbi:MAG: WD40 repeat domain-containing protein [Ignavibacteria bacterium]|nr:WD40 repeat domain-containing protein [Ignavibacteria bacterium]